MKNQATLLIRIVRNDGSRTYAKPAYASNRRLRPQFAILEGKAEYHPEGVYYLRREGKRSWRSVGTQATDALNALALQEHLMKGTALGIEAPDVTDQVSSQPTEDRQKFEFLLGTGCREREVMFMGTRDIDSKLVLLRFEPSRTSAFDQKIAISLFQTNSWRSCEHTSPPALDVAFCSLPKNPDVDGQAKPTPPNARRTHFRLSSG